MGSELRRPLGITIIGGLIFSQLLTLYTTPVIYLFFDELAEQVAADAPAQPAGAAGAAKPARSRRLHELLRALHPAARSRPRF